MSWHSDIYKHTLWNQKLRSALRFSTTCNGHLPSGTVPYMQADYAELSSIWPNAYQPLIKRLPNARQTLTLMRLSPNSHQMSPNADHTLAKHSPNAHLSSSTWATCAKAFCGVRNFFRNRDPLNHVYPCPTGHSVKRGLCRILVTAPVSSSCTAICQDFSTFVVWGLDKQLIDNHSEQRGL